jgi:hypothetical protein
VNLIHAANLHLENSLRGLSACVDENSEISHTETQDTFKNFFKLTFMILFKKIKSETGLS